ncbi:MAG TPA: hypothetical protein VKT82_35020 [Ktedonobacterales bacterium]|nr:hypothetical protein [Ktedonobacterales bacterium]
MLFDPYAYDLTISAGQPALADDPLLEVPDAARADLWKGLTEAVEGALDLWDLLPAGGRSAPPYTIQHSGKRRFQPQALREQTLAGWHRLVGIELRLAAQALEGIIQEQESATHYATLAEQCARVGQLYTEMQQRAGAWMAQALLRWELRMLRYRASPVVSRLVYD